MQIKTNYKFICVSQIKMKSCSLEGKVLNISREESITITSLK